MNSLFLSNQKELNEKVFSVSELIGFLNEFFLYLRPLKVKGEIFEVKIHHQGYGFLKIKDTQTQVHSLDCFLGYFVLEKFSHLLKEGLEVVVVGLPYLYKNGQFRLEIKDISLTGEGALKRAFELLEKELSLKGYFDESRKKPIPKIVQTIGLLTSKAGAAINDFKKNLGAHGFKIYFFDIRVEGDYAESSIVKGINWFNKYPHIFDVLVLIRGGGGLEELRAFNSKEVARAIVFSKIPIITGIGHEKDKTIADKCADLSLSTPTAVALFLKNQRENLLLDFENLVFSLTEEVTAKIESQKNKIFDFEKKLENYFLSLINQKKFLLLKFKNRLLNVYHQFFSRFNFLRNSLLKLFFKSFQDFEKNKYFIFQKQKEVFELMKNKVVFFDFQLQNFHSFLTSFDPDLILKRGYSLVYHLKDKKIIKDVNDLEIKDKLLIKFFKGRIIARVEKKYKK